jgi:putative hydrolase of the HAD superfamily
VSAEPAQAPRAVIFDLGGTLVDWPDWAEDAPRRWGLSYDTVTAELPDRAWPARDDFVRACLEAEAGHWRRVDEEHWSGPPTGLVFDAFHRLGRRASEDEVMAVLQAYAWAVEGWALLVPGAVETLRKLRERGYRLGLLSNTWWAAEWHNADLATHGLADFLDTVAYTSDLPHSKPHRSVFLEVAGRLGVEPRACVMVGDRQIDDISGALGVGMRAVWVRNARPWPLANGVVATAEIDSLTEIPDLLRGWGGA